MMDNPQVFESYRAAPGIEVLPTYFPLPGFGIIPLNSFLIRAAEPILVDSGLTLLGDQFIEKLASIIDLPEIKWLWLTHTDQDHIGGLQHLLDRSPGLRVITTFLGAGKMSLFRPLPMERVYLLNPGQSLSLNDRTLTAVKPPSYDAPETTGFFDSSSKVFFCADCFGALLSEPAENAAAIKPQELREGLVTWATIDAPWLHMVDRGLFSKGLNNVREMSPELILSSHLPVARGMTDQLLEYLSAVPDMEAFLGPDQIQLEAMLTTITKS